MDEEALANLFNVGPIFGEVSYDGDDAVARTNDPWLDAVGQGEEIAVRLDEYDVSKGNIAMWRALLQRMRDELEERMILGQMHPVWIGPAEGEAYREFAQAVDALGEEFFTITPSPELLQQAREDEDFCKPFELLKRFVEAQQQRAEENITLGHAVERHKQRTEEIRRIVEGDG
jgi:hypothetical protein